VLLLDLPFPADMASIAGSLATVNSIFLNISPLMDDIPGKKASEANDDEI
jgi:hypothetical protein